jgi:hypothetical protein
VVATYVLLGNDWVQALPSYYTQTLILLLFGTIVLYVYLFRFERQDLFVHVYLLSMVVKLLAYGAYNFFVIIEDENGAVANVVWFMVVYLIFTLLEIAFLYRKVSK